jgi:hypothetical protein
VRQVGYLQGLYRDAARSTEHKILAEITSRLEFYIVSTGTVSPTFRKFVVS